MPARRSRRFGPELVEDVLLRTLFVREAEALKSVRDDAVVGYEGVFKDEAGRVYLAMSFVDGPPLARRMRERPLDPDEVLRLMARLARDRRAGGSLSGGAGCGAGGGRPGSAAGRHPRGGHHPPGALRSGAAGSGVVPDLKILFPFNSAELTTQARAQLDQLGRALAPAELAPFRFTIAGHTDAVGSEAHNEGLSARRARAVVDYLVAGHGIARARLAAVGLGERELAVPADPTSALNRRVEVRTAR